MDNIKLCSTVISTLLVLNVSAVSGSFECFFFFFFLLFICALSVPCAVQHFKMLIVDWTVLAVKNLLLYCADIMFASTFPTTFQSPTHTCTHNCAWLVGQFRVCVSPKDGSCPWDCLFY